MGPGDPLADVIGRAVTECESIFNEVGDLAAVELAFGHIVLGARMFDAEIVAERVTRA